MRKVTMHEYERNGAVAVFFIVISGFLMVSNSWADTSYVPVPERKPAFEEPDSQTVKYSLKDFAKTLLDFGTPPVPPQKPQIFASSGVQMNDADLQRYKQIFALQDEGKIKEADALIKDLSNMRLRGYVLYQRYMHPTAYKSSFEELRNWLALYPDYAGADKVYALAQRKQPSGYQGKLPEPKSRKGVARLGDPLMYAGKKYQSPAQRSDEQNAKVKAHKDKVLAAVRGRDLQQAAKYIQSEDSALLDSVEKDQLKAALASGYLYAGQITKAYNLARQSAETSGEEVPMAGWVAGLAAWQLGKYKESAKYFEIPASSAYASGWTSSAGAYWAARAHMRRGNVKAVSHWLEAAMQHPRTFYGLIATRALGRDFEFNWDIPSFTGKYHEALSQSPAGARALDLAAAGQGELAEAELLRIDPGNNQAMRDALLSYADYAELPALALRLGSYASSEGRTYDAALYPKGSWRPRSGYKVDPALVHAIMRQESRFDPLAESRSGAVGLMQLMPKTANAVARQKNLSLTNPETNLEIGQKYLGDLLKAKHVDRDILSLLIAYNAGPGNLARWREQWNNVDDPLLFIELIPSGETRIYVERVLANYWIYRLREDLPTPTLDAVAEGRKAEYAYKPADGRFKLAENR